MRPANNYIKVVSLGQLDSIYPFYDRDRESLEFALIQGRRKLVQLDLAELVVWRIPEDARDESLYKGLKTANPCPAWAHLWLGSDAIGSHGKLCTRCGYYDGSGDMAELQRFDFLHSQALGELDD
jgi:hypothetical protein